MFPIAQGNGNLLVEAESNILDDHRKVVANVVNAVALIFRKSGIGHPYEFLDQFIDNLGIGLVEHVQLVNMPLLIIVGNDFPGNVMYLR